jgi:hypothetical protein
MRQSLDQLRHHVNEMLGRLPPGEPLSWSGSFRLHNGKEDRQTFRQLAFALARTALGFAGSSAHSTSRRHPLSGEFSEFLIEGTWASPTAFGEFWNSKAMHHFQEEVRPLTSVAPTVRFFGKTTPTEIVQQTGQTICWNQAGHKVSPHDAPGVDGASRGGRILPKPRFHDNKDGTVTDRATGLIWVKDITSFDDVTWFAGLATAGSLQSGQHGLSDGSTPGQWRLPNLSELQSVLSLNNESGPSIDHDNPFKGVTVANYWSSTTVPGISALAFYTAFAVGCPVFDLKINTMKLWPVRGGDNTKVLPTGVTTCYGLDLTNPANMFPVVAPSGDGQDGDLRLGIPAPRPRFRDNKDGTILDGLTGLIWLKDANVFGKKNWSGAIAACNGLKAGEQGLQDHSAAGDWRLPSFNELRSLLDYSQFGPALPKGHPFINVLPTLYWSSTTVPSAPNLARFVFVGMGPGVWDHKDVVTCLWPVRNAK